MVDANRTIEERLDRIERLLTKGQRETRRDLGFLAVQANLAEFATIALLCGACVSTVGLVFVGARMRAAAQENMPAWAYNMIWGWVGGSASQGRSNGNPARVIAAAEKWVGRDYKPGVSAMCASFIRSVLKDAGVDVGVASGSAGPLMADSFHGKELGRIILDPADLQPGDIVMFANTYDGPGRSPIPGRGRITHVEFYVGNGEIIGRSTMSAPVRRRPLTTFQFHSALRPAAYQENTVGGDDFVGRYVKAIARQESGSNYAAVNPHSGALGKYQFMPATLASTAQSCPGVGSVPSVSEFLGSPELQDRIMGCYVARALPTIQAKAADEFTQCRMMASYHYSGNPDNYNSTRPQSYAGAAYPSIAEYTKAVCRGF